MFFIGWRGHEDLRISLGCADLMVAPSVGEAFGAVYLEAMSAGLPVVATNTGGPPTFLNLDTESPEGWLIPPDDEDALVEVLVEALICPAERLTRAEAARASRLLLAGSRSQSDGRLQVSAHKMRSNRPLRQQLKMIYFLAHRRADLAERGAPDRVPSRRRRPPP